MNQVVRLSVRVRDAWNFPLNWRAVGVSLTIVFTLIAANIAVHMTTINPRYLSIYTVASVALVAHEMGVRAGVLAAVLMGLSCNCFFAGGFHFGFHAMMTGEIANVLTCLLVAFIVGPRAPILRFAEYPRRPEKNWSEVGTLPFTKLCAPGTGLHGSGIINWSVEPTGDWCADYEVGAAYLRVFMERAKLDKPRPLVSWIVADMIRAGRFTGIEAGFIQTGANAMLEMVGPRRPAPPPPRSQAGNPRHPDL